MAYLNTINANLTSAGGAGSVRVGFLEKATYPDGKSVASIAAVNEFGGSGPPRPFFRNMIKANAPSWGDDVGKVLKATNFDASRTLGLMGERIVGQLRQSIRDLTSPPLAPSTVRRKGFSKPLVETGVMLNSADYEVST